MIETMEFNAATDADVAADMANHRQDYRGFIRLLTWVAIASAILLILVFVVLSSADVTKLPLGEPARPAAPAAGQAPPRVP